MLHGFNTIILIGGQIKPKNIDGDKLEWKKAQKNPAKNKTSDPINKIKPNFNPRWTIKVWLPW
jgi:hypothetical protein